MNLNLFKLVAAAFSVLYVAVQCETNIQIKLDIFLTVHHELIIY